MHRPATLVLGLRSVKLRVCDAPQVAGIGGLVQGDFACHLALNVADTTIRDYVPFYLEFAENILELGQHVLDHFGFSGKLKIVDVYRHDCN